MVMRIEKDMKGSDSNLFKVLSQHMHRTEKHVRIVGLQVEI
jgi:hypothetical protein